MKIRHSIKYQNNECSKDMLLYITGGVASLSMLGVHSSCGACNYYFQTKIEFESEFRETSAT